MTGQSIAIAALVGLLAGAPAPLAAATADDFCAAAGGFAEAVMEGRQKGVTMSALMALYKDIPAEKGGDMLRAVVVAAFTETRYESRDLQLRATQDFRAAIELGCYQTVGAGAK